MKAMSNENQNNKQSLNLSVSILIAGVLIAGAVIYAVGAKNQPAVAPSGGNQPAPTFDQLMKLTSRDVILGDPNAPVTFIEYGDYQCPFCARFFSTVESSLKDNYIKDGKVRFVFRDLSILGSESQGAAEAAECAKDQGKFWPFHDALYTAEEADAQENNGNLNRDLFLRLAGQVGMNTKDFGSCYDAHKYTQVVKDVTRAAQAAGLNGTPSSLVNGQLVVGAQPYSYFSQTIDSLLK